MSTESKQPANGRIGIGAVLFIVFLVLKLTKVVTWSWWWVTAPLWIPLFLALVLGLFALIIFLKEE